VAIPVFRKLVAGRLENDVPPSPFNTFSAAGDVDGDGRPDLVVSGRNGRMAWLQNRGPAQTWPLRVIAEPGCMECGGCLLDLTGSGCADIVNGGDWRSDELRWWQNPGPQGLEDGRPWPVRFIARTGRTQFHDIRAGNVTNTGRPSLVFTNQGSGTTLYRLPLPLDPTVSPWPGLEVIARGLAEPNPRVPGGRQPEEGLAIGDVDGDGLAELVCGVHWYKYDRGAWQAHRYARDYLTTKIAIGDLDGDGRNEIILSEGDRCIYGWGAEGGKLAWFKPGPDVTALWEEHRLAEGLLDAHSLQVGDLTGSGAPDILVGEIGLADPRTDAYLHRPPRLLVYANDGRGGFTPHLIDEGAGTHDALLLDLFGDGRLAIFAKPLHGPEKWNIHLWVQE
jgi:hypothetical protein